MAPSLNIIAPSPTTQYSNDDTHKLLFPRYADAEHNSSPPSTASIESFDVLDSVAWRKGHAASGVQGRASPMWKRRKCQIISILVLLLVVGSCTFAGVTAVRTKNERIARELKEMCFKKEGGERCRLEPAWAKCVAKEGLGFCEGEFAWDRV